MVIIDLIALAETIQALNFAREILNVLNVNFARVVLNERSVVRINLGNRPVFIAVIEHPVIDTNR